MKVIKGIVIGMVMFSLFASACYIDHNYTRKNCVVVEASDEGALIKDNCGELWYWEESGYKVGDIVTMKMNDNCTSNYVEDDIITKIIKK